MLIPIGVLTVNGIHNKATIAALDYQLFFRLQRHLRVGHSLQYHVHYAHLVLMG